MALLLLLSGLFMAAKLRLRFLINSRLLRHARCHDFPACPLHSRSNNLLSHNCVIVVCGQPTHILHNHNTIVLPPSSGWVITWHRRRKISFVGVGVKILRKNRQTQNYQKMSHTTFWSGTGWEFPSRGQSAFPARLQLKFISERGNKQKLVESQGKGNSLNNSKPCRQGSIIRPKPNMLA